MNIYRSFTRLAMTVCLLAVAVPLSAADSGSADEWKFDAAIYMWGASMDVTPDGGDSIHISFNDILDNLDMTFMGMLNARKGRFSMFTDVIYMNLSDDVTGSAKILNQNIQTDINIGMKAWIVTAAGGYNLVDNGKYTLDLLGGARYINVDVPLKFRRLGRKTTPSGDLWDGIVGVRGKVNLADKWYLNYYADGGTGHSSSTWQGLAGLNYQFDKFEAGFGYRYLTWNMNDRDLEDLTVKGPYAGVRFLF